MKKRLILLAALCVTTSALLAQQATGSFRELASAGRANVELDFSKASIHGMLEEDFSEIEKDWTKDKPEVLADFLEGLTDKLQNSLIVGTRLETPCLIKVQVLSVTKKGDYTCDVAVLCEGQEVASIKSVKADGGTFGSALNLIKDGAESTGKKVGKLVYRELKKASKSKK